MTFEEKMAQAFSEASGERAKRLLNVEKKHYFSLAYKLWEHKTLKAAKNNKKNNRWTLAKARRVVAAIGVAACLLIGSTVFAVFSVGRYAFVTKPDYSKLFIDNLSSDKTTFEEYYGLPEEDGWELIDYDIAYSSIMLNYERGESKVFFWQRLIKSENTDNINTEKADIEMLSLYSENDGFLMEFESGTLIYWAYDGYLFNISSNLNKDEAVNLAYSTKIVDLPKNS